MFDLDVLLFEQHHLLIKYINTPTLEQMHVYVQYVDSMLAQKKLVLTQYTTGLSRIGTFLTV